MFSKFLAVAVLAAACVAPLTRANADGAMDGIATYSVRTPSYGVLSVTTQTGSHFTVMGEQLNGSYLPVSSGTIGTSGTINVNVPHTGLTNNNQPQYMVNVVYPNGSSMVFLAGAEGNDDRWWLD